MAFSGFTDETVPWFEGLMVNNSRDYFLANRKVYDRSVRGPLTELLFDLSVRIGGEPKHFRQNRDIRFSTDKSPYKSNSSGLLINVPGTSAVYYVSVSADGIHAATGYHQMSQDQLIRYRKSLTTAVGAFERGAHLRDILGVLGKHSLTVDTDSLSGLPRGIQKDSLNIDLVRYKTLTASKFLEPEKMNDSSVLDWICEAWSDSGELNKWLDENVGAAISV